MGEQTMDVIMRSRRRIPPSALVSAFVVMLLAAVAAAGVWSPSRASADLVPAATVAISETSTASPTSATGYATWSDVASAVATQIETARDQYAAGDMSTASSTFMSAYNSLYVASNFAAVVRDAIGSDTQTGLQDQFTTVQALFFSGGNADAIAKGVDGIARGLSTAATTLDATKSLASPSRYAKEQAAQVAADRKRLDAAKKKNTGKGDRTWADVADDMSRILDRAYARYAAEDGRAGAELVNEAYYQYYEKLGFEKNVMNVISGSRVSQVEYRFKETRQAMMAGTMSTKDVKTLVTGLKSMLVQDAATLDAGSGSDVNPVTRFVTSSFGQAFLILLREGLEAILVVAAIVAYLVKSGNRRMTRWVYLGIVLGLVASGILAFAFTMLFGGSGPQQEITEGIVALVAMLMLLYTSNWMLSKSSVEAWNSYIAAKTVSAVSAGSLLSLVVLSFLTVFREGAETVIFYQAMLSMTDGDTTGVWLGALCAAVVLVAVFLLIRYTSVKIPIRPFFIVTSVLMAVLVVAFAGGGVHALIEGDLVDAYYVVGVPTSDWLGLYPYRETLIAQIVAAVAVVVLMGVGWASSRAGSRGRRVMPAAEARPAVEGEPADEAKSAVGDNNKQEKEQQQ